MRKETLYIPFWLYSNVDAFQHYEPVFVTFTFHSGYILMMIEETGSGANTLLYIPFWLYSNGKDIRNYSCSTYFTFHSGYILMIKVP